MVAAGVLSFAGVYATRIMDSVSVDTSFDFYLVGVQAGEVKASAEQVRLDGGAGYIWDDNVVFSVYFQVEEAETICKNIQGQYPKATVLTYSSKEVVVPKSTKGNTIEMLKNLYVHIWHFADVANGLDDGLTQEKARSRLESLKKSFETLKKLYIGRKETVDLCETVCRWIEEKKEEVLFSQEIRFETCVVTEAFLKLIESQSL